MFSIQIIKADGKFSLKGLTAMLNSVQDGEYNISVKRKRKARTLDQNGWLWGCIYPLLLRGMLDAGWHFTSIEQVHEFFKKQMLIDRVVNKYTGEIIEFPASTANMNTVTFSTYCEKLRDYASEYLNIEIPDPERIETK